jgi:hypothetical protein
MMSCVLVMLGSLETDNFATNARLALSRPPNQASHALQAALLIHLFAPAMPDTLGTVLPAHLVLREPTPASQVLWLFKLF